MVQRFHARQGLGHEQGRYLGITERCGESDVLLIRSCLSHKLIRSKSGKPLGLLVFLLRRFCMPACGSIRLFLRSTGLSVLGASKSWGQLVMMPWTPASINFRTTDCLQSRQSADLPRRPGLTVLGKPLSTYANTAGPDILGNAYHQRAAFQAASCVFNL